MSIERLLTQPCTITTRTSGGVDENLDPIENETTTQTVCYLESQPVLRLQENQAERDLTRSNAICFLPAGTAITSEDAVTVGPLTYEVIGEPEHVWNPRLAVESHVRCHVQRAA
jgi:hypothetical protein